MMPEKTVRCPGFFISALKGGSGKTIITIGITAALRGFGKKTAPFKKGPDYIDAGWLSLAAGRPCYNLDTYLIEEQLVLKSYLQKSCLSNADIAVIEGNRGLFDGIDLDGKTSTAETSKLLGLPVILCLDCTKSTRTMAAAVLGCLHFDPDMTLGGVILNRVAGPRHRNNLINNIEHHTGVKVLGSLPKLRSHDFPERHMGLVPTPEHEWASTSIETAETIAKDNINIDEIIRLAEEETKTQLPDDIDTFCRESISVRKTPDSDPPVIGILRDSAFQFYYPENIEALEKEGAEIQFISPLKQTEFPELDGLYIGGGFPETHAKELTENSHFRESIKELADKGMPIYAECGGLMYMGRDLLIEGTSYPMTGIFPITFGVSEKPQGHGYVVAEVSGDNPFFEKSTEIKGHEFRYSRIDDWDEDENSTAFTMKRGTGMKDKKDGICHKNVLACYTHLHALGTPTWAPNFVKKAREFKQTKALMFNKSIL